MRNRRRRGSGYGSRTTAFGKNIQIDVCFPVAKLRPAAFWDGKDLESTYGSSFETARSIAHRVGHRLIPLVESVLQAARLHDRFGRLLYVNLAASTPADAVGSGYGGRVETLAF